MSITNGDLAAFMQLTLIPEQRCISSWRCARCDREPGIPVRWLWRNDSYGTALVDCDRCKWKWQEPGWRKGEDGVWFDNTYLCFGVGDGYAVWSRTGLGPTKPEWKASHGEMDDSAGIDDSDDADLTR